MRRCSRHVQVSNQTDCAHSRGHVDSLHPAFIDCRATVLFVGIASFVIDDTRRCQIISIWQSLSRIYVAQRHLRGVLLTVTVSPTLSDLSVQGSSTIFKRGSITSPSHHTPWSVYTKPGSHITWRLKTQFVRSPKRGQYCCKSHKLSEIFQAGWHLVM